MRQPDSPDVAWAELRTENGSHISCAGVADMPWPYAMRQQACPGKSTPDDAKAAVKLFWGAAACGERYSGEQDRRRYALEPEILPFARRRRRGPPADAEKSPFPEDKLDVVYSWGVAHHTQDTRQPVLEARHVVAPSGRLKRHRARPTLVGSHGGVGSFRPYSRQAHHGPPGGCNPHREPSH